jgi:hypothetical protein
MFMAGVTIVLVLLNALAAAITPVANATDDIRIVALEPQGPVAAGVETEFRIRVEIALESADDAQVYIGFNTESPGTYRMVASRQLRRGRQQVTFAVSIAPVNWSDRGDFGVMANVSLARNGSRWTPTASVRKTITVKD